MPTFTLSELAEHLGAKLIGDGTVEVESVASLDSAGDRQVAFLTNPKYKEQLQACSASAVIVAPAVAELCPTNAIVMANPYLGYAKAAQLLDTSPEPSQGIHPTAVLDDVTLGQGVSVGAYTVIEPGSIIADGARIGANCYIGHCSQIGAETRIFSNVVMYHRTHTGVACRIHSGAVIGADGFGYANDAGNWVRIPQTGQVILGDNVEIGACTTVDRGALENTVIHSGVIIDDHCHVAHNVVMGERTAVAGATTFAGSVTVGKQCVIGGASVINGHIEIADNVHYSGMSMVMRGAKEPGVYSSGVITLPNKEWRKNAARFPKLDEMYRRIKVLEDELNALKRED
ncbi:UDP-3-O-(3-hydroxymyristoyl)glucosamine N-acyltransferase [Corallincola luteus]|uniref:UDP-3-O-acylglucosamine N-acyltransferase n=1 Tax=Corallincola luteus TaxID=1775177 RepID=A0ABY2AJR2_9GAMM|nr:UDP-3-O-(3-hydroxymyristoyl)glucosamine N-acyltransferase [Corallincola luteus]TCI03017.1 UDP-3-O-(3-hydroxymyristoyl)glucosamine N-acyltransferase [Corallincola luteus]